MEHLSGACEREPGFECGSCRCCAEEQGGQLGFKDTSTDPPEARAQAAVPPAWFLASASSFPVRRGARASLSPREPAASPLLTSGPFWGINQTHFHFPGVSATMMLPAALGGSSSECPFPGRKLMLCRIPTGKSPEHLSGLDPSVGGPSLALAGCSGQNRPGVERCPYSHPFHSAVCIWLTEHWHCPWPCKPLRTWCSRNDCPFCRCSGARVLLSAASACPLYR